MKHITLLSTQIKLCLFISTHKSLRSKATLSHRFKILRAIWHKTAISHKNFLIGTSFAFYQIAPPLGILNRSPGVQRSADLWGTFWLLFRTLEFSSQVQEQIVKRFKRRKPAKAFTRTGVDFENNISNILIG